MEKKCPEITDALGNREFCVWYQPQVDMQTGEIAGAEALVRWNRPGRGMILPGEFIPEMERHGLMPLLDQEVLRIVCEDMREAKRAGISFGPVSVNLSRLYAEHYRTVCGEKREELRFEFTETDRSRDGDRELREFADMLREKGFRIAMDDYGMGSSTLKMLHQIPFDILKLDRYFVSRIGEEKGETILRSTIAMARELGMEIVAEGVERRAQVRFLLEHGCRLAQGYYYSEPLGKEAYLSFRKQGKRLPEAEP